MKDHEITDLLRRWSEHDEEAAAELFRLLYRELHDLASIQTARRGRDCIVQTTMVLHEAYLKLSEPRKRQWTDRQHFFAYSASTMRNVLVDLARKNATRKRGGGSRGIDLDARLDLPLASGQGELALDDILAMDGALEALASVDPERARIVELRYFTGMSPAEIGAALELSESTVARRLRSAKAWLARYFEKPGA